MSTSAGLKALSSQIQKLLDKSILAGDEKASAYLFGILLVTFELEKIYAVPGDPDSADANQLYRDIAEQVASYGVGQAGAFLAVSSGVTGTVIGALSKFGKITLAGFYYSFLAREVIDALADAGITLVPADIDLSELTRSEAEEIFEVSSGDRIQIIGTIRGDTIRDTPFDDTVAGLLGKDLFVKQGGNDFFLGGKLSRDIVDYRNAEEGLMVEFADNLGRGGLWRKLGGIYCRV